LLRYLRAKGCSPKDKLALEASKAGRPVKYLMTTSAAVDVIQGGVKLNALPERTVSTVNHRINVGDHSSDVKAKITRLASSIAKKYNLTLNAFEGLESPSSITLQARNTTLEPAPVTPTNVDQESAYRILSGTTRALYGEDVLTAPGIMTGNTDTRYYWDLSSQIFRYAVGWDPDDEPGLGNIHTVNEKISVKAHVAAARWFSYFIRNMDAAELA
jgi:Gly-Xaa carboxypeptidase